MRSLATERIGKFIIGEFITGKFIIGNFGFGRFITGKFVFGYFIIGKFIFGNFIIGNFTGYKVQPVKLDCGALHFHLWNVLSRAVPDPREIKGNFGGLQIRPGGCCMYKNPLFF